MTSSVYLLCGLPGSGKTTYVNAMFQESANLAIFGGDRNGPKWGALYKEALRRGIPKIILDNTHLTKSVRKPVIDLARANGYEVHCLLFSPSKTKRGEYEIERNQIRLLQRQIHTMGHLVFAVPKGQTVEGVVPIGALFHARRVFQEPTLAEGFQTIQEIPEPPIQWPKEFRNRAILFDIDGTLRATEHLPNKYPTDPSEVVPYTDVVRMRKRIQEYRNQGYVLCGVSNQSGIAKGILTESDCAATMEATKRMLDAPDLDICWCPHQAVPVSCYCRKPQSGLGVHFIYKYRLDPKECIMVGDRTTDRTFAERLGMRFVYTDEFWAK